MTENPAGQMAPPTRFVGGWVRILMLCMVFLCGSTVGAVSGAFWMRKQMLAILQHPETLPARILPRIRAELALSNDQAESVEAVVRKRHAAMEAVRAAGYPKQLAEFHAMQSEISELLTPIQRPRWATLCETVEQRYLPARPAGPPPANLIFSRFDANRDDMLTESEVPLGMWRRLRFADDNGDGNVTLEEYLGAQPNADAN